MIYSTIKEALEGYKFLNSKDINLWNKHVQGRSIHNILKLSLISIYNFQITHLKKLIKYSISSKNLYKKLYKAIHV